MNIRNNKRRILIILLTTLILNVVAIRSNGAYALKTEEITNKMEGISQEETQVEVKGENQDKVEAQAEQQVKHIEYSKKIAENDNFILYINEEIGGIAVKSKKDGFMWTSNPIDAPQDPLAVGVNKTNLTSPIIIKYYNQKPSRWAMVGIETVVNSTTAVANKGGLSYELIENGIKIIYNFVDEGIVIPVAYCLDEDSLNVQILVGEIEEKGKNKLMEITLLPYFAAGSTKDEGYLLIPDGCGALIYFNNNKAQYGTYSAPVYGRDKGLIQTKLTESEEEIIRMPVFGLKNGKHGYFAVIEKGDAVASISALSSGTITSYNTVYPTFRYRARRTIVYYEGNQYAADSRGDTAEIDMLPSHLTKLDCFSVKYYLLTKDDLSYVDMAKVYQNYLIHTKGLSKQALEQEVPFYLNLYGALEKDVNILGFKIKKLVALTTYREAIDILQLLRGNNIKDIVFRYQGWQKGGLEGKIPAKIEYERVLGGKNDFKQLLHYITENDVHFFPDFDFINLYRSGNGFSRYNDVVQTLGDTPAYQYIYDLNSLSYIRSSRWYLLSPNKVMEAFDKLINRYEELGIQNISLTTVGNTVYSDFTSKSNGIDRADVAVLWEDLFRKARKNIGNILVENANAYVFPYVAHIVNAPISTSQFDIADEEVPFYQIVLRGYVNYSTPPVNLHRDPEELLLKAVETGSYLTFSWIARENALLSNTKYNYLFSVEFNKWLDSAISYYHETRKVLELISGQEIVDHRKIQDQVYKTKYENGVEVIVNYSNKDVTVQGTVVKARSYSVVGGYRR